jgi:photosystem II stability/assembly factor-like uncharacterized protein
VINTAAQEMRGAVLMIFATTSIHAQWIMQQSHTTASLRGIHNVGSGVAWASGSQGTVLRTTDGGQRWRTCSVAAGTEKLDFRGIQGFDANTAIVMSSGTGALSRLYKTVDGCRTWKLVFTNPDESGFWDAIQLAGPGFGVLIGDQVHGHIPVFFSTDGGDAWKQFDPKAFSAIDKKQSFFAASNTSLMMDRNARFYLLTGGGTNSVIKAELRPVAGKICQDCVRVSSTRPGLAVGETAGGFSLASRDYGSNLVMVAVGGDFKAPDQTAGTAAFWIDDHRHDAQWQAPVTSPHGYRSAVAYYAPGKAWITVGPNGTDVSTDDGRNWRALKLTTGQNAGADRNWNALSLPFAAGPNGRIGKLDSRALGR